MLFNKLITESDLIELYSNDDCYHLADKEIKEKLDELIDLDCCPERGEYLFISLFGSPISKKSLLELDENNYDLDVRVETESELKDVIGWQVGDFVGHYSTLAIDRFFDEIMIYTVLKELNKTINE